MIRIAAEEAWAPSDLLERYRKLLAEKPAAWDPGFHSLWGFFLGPKPRATALVRRIQDLGEERLADMDSSGITKQLVFLTAPGVQVFDAPTAVSLARDYNDEDEEAAYAVGAAALVPYAALRRFVRQGRTSTEIARRFNVSRELVEYRLKVSRLWGEYRARHEAEVAARYAQRQAAAARFGDKARDERTSEHTHNDGHRRHAG